MKVKTCASLSSRLVLRKLFPQVVEAKVVHAESAFKVGSLLKYAFDIVLNVFKLHMNVR